MATETGAVIDAALMAQKTKMDRATEAQSAAFTADLRKTEKHPALAPRPQDRPVWLWISAGVDHSQSLEILMYPPGHPDALPLTSYPKACALIYQGERKDGAWVSPPSFVGYMTAPDARVIAIILERMNGADPPTHGASVETLNV